MAPPPKPLQPGQRRAVPGHKGIYERVTREGETKYDAIVSRSDGGKSSTLHLGTRDELGDAVALRNAYHNKVANKAGADSVAAPGMLTVRQLGAMALEKAPKHKRTRWNGRVCRAAFIDWPATQVTELEIQKWVDDQANELIATGRNAGETPCYNTVFLALCLLRTVYKWGAMPKRRYVTHNPALHVTISSSTDAVLKSNRNLFDYLREADAIRVIQGESKIGLEPWVKFMVSMFSGARPGDVWRARWERVDWDVKSIQFTSAKTSKRESRDYTVHMLSPLFMALRKWWMRHGQPTSGLIFPSATTGEAYASGYDAGWQDIKQKRKYSWVRADGTLGTNKETEVRVTPGYRSKLGITRDVPLYSLRHTCACNLLLGTKTFTGGRTWSREEVQSHLGHTGPEATEHYMRALSIAGHRAVKESREAIRASREWLGRM